MKPNNLFRAGCVFPLCKTITIIWISVVYKVIVSLLLIFLINPNFKNNCNFSGVGGIRILKVNRIWVLERSGLEKSFWTLKIKWRFILVALGKQSKLTKQRWWRDGQKRLRTATGTTQYGNLASEEKGGGGCRERMTTALVYNRRIGISLISAEM